MMEFDLFRVAQISEAYTDKKTTAAVQAFLDNQIAPRYLTLVHVGYTLNPEGIHIPFPMYGNPLVMARYSDLFAQFISSENLLSLKEGEPLHVSKDTLITQETLFGLIRVWLYMNGLTSNIVDMEQLVTVPRLLSAWHWINYMGLDIRTEAIREYIYTAAGEVDTIQYIPTGPPQVYADDYTDDEQIQPCRLLSPGQVSILHQITGRFKLIREMCEKSCMERCKCEYDCIITAQRNEQIRCALSLYQFQITRDSNEIILSDGARKIIESSFTANELWHIRDAWDEYPKLHQGFPETFIMDVCTYQRNYEGETRYQKAFTEVMYLAYPDRETVLPDGQSVLILMPSEVVYEYKTVAPRMYMDVSSRPPISMKDVSAGILLYILRLREYGFRFLDRRM